MAQMDVADTCPEFALGFYGGGDGAVRGAPRYDQQIAFGIAYGNNIRNVLDDGFDFCGANANHVFVVQRFVIDVASDVLLFQTADAVFEAGSSWNGPRARQRVRIASVGFEVHGVRRKFHFEVGDGVEIGNAPGFSSVCQITVRKNNDRDHVFHGDARGFDRGRESHGFRLEGHTRAGRSGDGKRASVGSADGGADGGDFVFGLESNDTKIFVLRKFVEDVRGRSD